MPVVTGVVNKPHGTTLQTMRNKRFYTPFGVRWFGTIAVALLIVALVRFLYALRREVVRNWSTPTKAPHGRHCFYTPFGVRWFGTARRDRSGQREPRSRFYTPFGVRWFGTLPPWTGR